MLVINSGRDLERALAYPLDLKLMQLLLLRRDRLGTIENNARFAVVEAGDTTTFMEEALGFSVFQNAPDGTCFGFQ